MSYGHAEKIAAMLTPHEAPPRVVPDWTELYDREDVRRLLADRDIGGLFRVLKDDAGLTQRQLAELTGMSQSEVSDILKSRRVQGYHVLVRIAEGLSIPRGLIGLSYGEGGAYGEEVTAAEPPEDEDVLRRDLLAAGSVALVGVPVLGKLLDKSTGPGEMWLPSQVGMPDVAEIENTTEQLRSAARLQGGQARAVSAAAIEYGRLTQVPAAGPVAARLGSQLAELSTLAGWCCYDSGLHRRARWHYRKAMNLAVTVRDDYQFADVLQYVGILERAAGHPNDAVTFYQLAGIRLGAKGDPGLVAWGHGLSALALATMGHEQATEQLRRARGSWQPSNAFERADMDYQTALVKMELGDLDGAERFVASIDGVGRHRPVGTFAGILRATIHVQAGEPRGLGMAKSAIDAVALLHSQRARERLVPLAAALGSRPGSDHRELARIARQIATARV